MRAAPPPPPPTNPVARIASDLAIERRAKGVWPPGPTSFSAKRTVQFAREPLPILLDAYERFGPIFTIRVLHARVIFMLGPAANHYITVSHAQNFRWRDGGMGELIPLLGDGLLTIDGDIHRRARRIMLPAFHHDAIVGYADTMVDEASSALAAWAPGQTIDLYDWTRHIALRIAMRALFGLDPDGAQQGIDVAAAFERALGFWGRDYFVQTLRGPATPWARMWRERRSLDRVIYAELDRRRRTGERGTDVLSMLMDAQDESGGTYTDRELRDHAMTLLFAGHDTTTSTVTFLIHELAKQPAERDRLVAELDEVLGGEPPRAEHLTGTALPRLEMAIDETLRLYPPAWIGPRRSIEPFEFDGKHVGADIPVHYCSYASHRLASVFPDPERFDPERFTPDAKAALPKGAYVPFGGGSRTCIGMRFGQMEIRALAALILQRFSLDHEPGWTLKIRQTPTLGPRGGLPVCIRSR